MRGCVLLITMGGSPVSVRVFLVFNGVWLLYGWLIVYANLVTISKFAFVWVTLLVLFDLAFVLSRLPFGRPPPVR